MVMSGGRMREHCRNQLDQKQEPVEATPVRSVVQSRDGMTIQSQVTDEEGPRNEACRHRSGAAALGLIVISGSAGAG